MTSADRPAVVGLLAPMPSEMQPLAKALSLQRAKGDQLYKGAVGATALVASRTGIGTSRAAEATARLLDAVHVEHVMVVGIAGGLGSSAVGDVLFPEVVVDKTTGMEYRSSPLGGVIPRDKLMTHDDFDMTPEEQQQLVADGFVAVDMETAAVASVCEQRGCAWSAIRAVSDLVGVTPGDVITLANADGSPNLGAAVRYLVTKPWRIPRLVRLGLDSRAAAQGAARAAARVLATGPSTRS